MVYTLLVHRLSIHKTNLILVANQNVGETDSISSTDGDEALQGEDPMDNNGDGMGEAPPGADPMDNNGDGMGEAPQGGDPMNNNDDGMGEIGRAHV